MGIRQTQNFGLSPNALNFLERSATRVNPCSVCGRDSGYLKHKVGNFGMFDEEFLYEYQLKTGGVAREKIQMEVWDSGPMIFLKLELSNGNQFQWSEQELLEKIPQYFDRAAAE